MKVTLGVVNVGDMAEEEVAGIVVALHQSILEQLGDGDDTSLRISFEHGTPSVTAEFGGQDMKGVGKRYLGFAEPLTDGKRLWKLHYAEQRVFLVAVYFQDFSSLHGKRYAHLCGETVGHSLQLMLELTAVHLLHGSLGVHTNCDDEKIGKCHRQYRKDGDDDEDAFERLFHRSFQMSPGSEVWMRMADVGCTVLLSEASLLL